MFVSAIKRGRYTHAKKVETYQSAQKKLLNIKIGASSVTVTNGNEHAGQGQNQTSPGQGQSQTSPGFPQSHNDNTQNTIQQFSFTSHSTTCKYSTGYSTRRFPASTQSPADVHHAQFEDIARQDTSEQNMYPAAQHAVNVPPVAHQHYINRNISALPGTSDLNSISREYGNDMSIPIGHPPSNSQPLNLSTSVTQGESHRTTSKRLLERNRNLASLLGLSNSSELGDTPDHTRHSENTTINAPSSVPQLQTNPASDHRHLPISPPETEDSGNILILF